MERARRLFRVWCGGTLQWTVWCWRFVVSPASLTSHFLQEYTHVCAKQQQTYFVLHSQNWNFRVKYVLSYVPPTIPEWRVETKKKEEFGLRRLAYWASSPEEDAALSLMKGHGENEYKHQDGFHRVAWSICGWKLFVSQREKQKMMTNCLEIYR